MRTEGIDEAVRAAGGIGALARTLGISQPAVSNWQRVPADRVIAVETATGVSRSVLRPDLYATDESGAGETADELDVLRARHYGLLSLLLGRAPTADLLGRIARLDGEDSPLGHAHAALAAAARSADPDAVSREFFDLFIGVGRGELLPFASYYLTGFLNERPLARVRADMAEIGIERADGVSDPEDHIAILLDAMASLASGRVEAAAGTDGRFFDRHLAPWADRFFADLETSTSASFYRPVAALGRLFMDIEAEAFAIDA